MTGRKRIMKNTMYMYFRMILIMVVNIYASRVILDKLGVNDYGLYNAVTSAVGIISFVISTLNTGAARFLTFELGKNDFQALSQTFSIIFQSYLIISICILLLLETIGLWYMNTHFVIPEGRENAVFWVYQISIVVIIITFLEVPFSSTLVAHEKFVYYAYIGILDSVLKLSIIYLITIATIDKLIFYSILVLISKCLIFCIYIGISKCKFKEVRITKNFEIKIIRSILNFTSWTFIANISNTIISQGSILLMNFFFTPAVIASKALASQINGSIMQFVNNFRTAVNPQIIKSHAAGKERESQKLLLLSTSLSFDLMLILGLPCFFIMNTILSLWLIEVPPLATIFTKLIILTQCFTVIESSFYTPFVAAGKLKQISLCGVVSCLIYFILLYGIYAAGGDVMWIQYLYFIDIMIWSFIIKPYYMVNILGYNIKDVYKCLISCIKVFIVSFVPSYFLSEFMENNIISQILLFIIVLFICLFSSFFFLEKEIRNKINELIKLKLGRL